ncbi:hypothetical protein DFH11DRAFT_1729147 [Phellopilus nigrolimitatus]|nr:hypothetical protein DFH11DRAFT_1729147 [Phellopilus nigrolimitatus]
MHIYIANGRPYLTRLPTFFDVPIVHRGCIQYVRPIAGATLTLALTAAAVASSGSGPVPPRAQFEGERESKHPADFSNKPDVNAEEDDDEDDEDGARRRGSGSGKPGPSGSGLGGSGGGSGGGGGGGGGSSSRLPQQGGQQQQGQQGQQRGGMMSGRSSTAAGGMNIGLDVSEPPPHTARVLTHFDPLCFVFINLRTFLNFRAAQLDYRPPLSLPHVPHHLQIPSHLSPTSYNPSASLPVSLERTASSFGVGAGANVGLHAPKRPRLDSGAGSPSYPGGPSAYTIDDPHAHAHAAYGLSSGGNVGGGGGGGSPSQSNFFGQNLGFGRPSPQGGRMSGQSGGGGGYAPLYGQASNPFAGLLAGAGSPGGGGSSSASSHSHGHHPGHHSSHPSHSSHSGHSSHTAHQAHFDASPLEWPMHGAPSTNASNPSMSSASSASSGAPQPPGSNRASGGSGGGSSDTSWLDFLSSAAPASGAGGASAASPVLAAHADSRPGSVSGGGKRARSTSIKEEESDASVGGSRVGANGDGFGLGGLGKMKTLTGEALSDVRSDVSGPGPAVTGAIGGGESERKRMRY